MLETRVNQCTSQGLAISAWSYATAGQADSRLFNAIAESALARVSSFQTQGLANLVWAMATAGHPAPALFAGVAREARGRLAEFQTQGLANMAWAFAKSGCADEALFMSFAREVPPRLEAMSTQELANFAWAFATAGYAAPELFAAIGDAAVSRLPEMKEQELANLAWAFATAGLDHPTAIDAIADEAEARVQRLAPQGLANLAWAFAIVAGLSANSVKDAERAASVFGGTGALFVMTGDVPTPTGAAGMPAAGAPRRRFHGYFHALARDMHEHGRARDMSAQGLAIVSWAFATLGHASPSAFAALGEVILARLDDLSALGMTNIAWAFATAGHGDLIFDQMSVALQVRREPWSAVWPARYTHPQGPRVWSDEAQPRTPPPNSGVSKAAPGPPARSTLPRHTRPQPHPSALA